MPSEPVFIWGLAREPLFCSHCQCLAFATQQEKSDVVFKTALLKPVALHPQLFLLNDWFPTVDTEVCSLNIVCGPELRCGTQFSLFPKPPLLV